MLLTNEEYYQIQQHVFESELTIHSVQEDVIDHLCCIAEKLKSEGYDGEYALSKAYTAISKEELRNLQHETIYFLTYKKQRMKVKAMFISAYAAVVFLVSGLFLLGFGYVLELPDIIGFAMILGSVSIFSLGFLPLYFFQKYKQYTGLIKA